MARLAEQEQQKVIQFIEAGKSLQDKFRFLLCDDKREIDWCETVRRTRPGADESFDSAAPMIPSLLITASKCNVISETN
jgi:hypothetical protein